MSETTTPTTPHRLTSEERSEKLAYVLRSDTASGWRVISQTGSSAQLEKGKHTNHVLHLILSIVTIGIWIPVWIIVAVAAGQKQRYVAVDEFGNVSRS